MRKLIFAILMFLSSLAFADCQLYSLVDHSRYIMSPAHQVCTCNTCHKSANSMLKGGLSTACSSCHLAGTSVATTILNAATHIPIAGATCESCHSMTAWNPASMNHTVIAATSCATCHSGQFRGQNAMSKPAEHIPTTLDCKECHKSTRNWDASWTHQGVVAGTCSTCHNGSIAKGKTPNHLPTILECDSCHKNYSSFTGALFHSNVSTTADCLSCHNGLIASGKPALHPAVVEATCESCHTRAGQTWQCVMNNLGHKVYAWLAHIFTA